MGWVVNATPRPLYPLERPGTHCTGGCVGPRAGLNGCRKSCPPTGIRSRTLQTVASRYTDYDTRPLCVFRSFQISRTILNEGITMCLQFNERYTVHVCTVFFILKQGYMFQLKGSHFQALTTFRYQMLCPLWDPIVFTIVE